MWAASKFLRWVALAFALAYASAVPGRDETAPVAKPEVQVGDEWHYRVTDYPTNVPRIRNVLSRVTFVGPGVILTTDDADQDSVWTPEWGVLAFGGAGITYDKPRNLFNFPLKVGSSHRLTYEVVAQRGSHARFRYWETVKVVGWEDVVVPAGTFRALKLESEGTYHRLDIQGGVGVSRNEIWYVPEVKRWVKWTYGVGRSAPFAPHQKTTIELTAYKVQ